MLYIFALSFSTYNRFLFHSWIGISCYHSYIVMSLILLTFILLHLLFLTLSFSSCICENFVALFKLFSLFLSMFLIYYHLSRMLPDVFSFFFLATLLSLNTHVFLRLDTFFRNLFIIILSEAYSTSFCHSFFSLLAKKQERKNSYFCFSWKSNFYILS